MTKACTKCLCTKNLEDFDIHAGRPDGRIGYCKDCRKKQYNQRYAENKNGVRDRQKQYREHLKTDLVLLAEHRANASKRCIAHRARKKMLPNYSEIVKHESRRSILSRHGVRKEQYDKMELAQGGKCKICGGVNKSGRKLAVDHCHTTGKIRDLLCSKCNVGIGNFNDNPELLIAAAEYLKNHKNG